MEHLYKDAVFYNDYFSGISNIVLTEPFSQKDNLWVGVVEFKNTFHPLKVVVEIPVTFPHHKLTFWTKSLVGYPHLIYMNGQKGSWFCLNTPFAETAEEQLNQEMSRLYEWIERQMRPDLKAVIDDPEVSKALKRVNAYSWENLDEINEYSSDAMLTFIGKDWNLASRYSQTTGVLPCIRNGSNKLFVIDKLRKPDAELPYILVDEIPEDMSDFLLMKAQYKWDEETCHHLLPKIIPEGYLTQNLVYENKEYWNGVEKDTARQKMDEAKEILGFKDIPQKHRECIDGTFESLENELQTHNRIKGVFEDSKKVILDPNPDDADEMAEYEKRMWEEEYACNVYPYEAHHFALGVRVADEIIWLLFSTQRCVLNYKSIKYDLGIRKIEIKDLIGIPLYREMAQFVKSEMFFGRGQLNRALCERKIAIIGAGAVGSMLAESLVRGGAGQIALYDNDLVEPGNICRSGYGLKDLGDSKVDALAKKLRTISPFCTIRTNGLWSDNPSLGWLTKYQQGEFYSNINYNSQKNAISQLEDNDLVIDCTGSNELLHFLSYSLNDKDFISCCITNRAQDFLCLTNRDGNVFQQRKMQLARIEQDTENFYVEGTGCWSPTFMADNCDIAALVNLFIRDLNSSMADDEIPHSTVWSYRTGGVVADRIRSYQLMDNSGIRLYVNSETLLDAEEMADVPEGNIGYLLGGYSKDGKDIFITHCIADEDAEKRLTDIFNRSQGVIDYVGDYTYSFEESDVRRQGLVQMMEAKAADTDINTNNPLLATRNMDGTITFYLYINGDITPFMPLDR